MKIPFSIKYFLICLTALIVISGGLMVTTQGWSLLFIWIFTAFFAVATALVSFFVIHKNRGAVKKKFNINPSFLLYLVIFTGLIFLFNQGDCGDAGTGASFNFIQHKLATHDLCDIPTKPWINLPLFSMSVIPLIIVDPASALLEPISFLSFVYPLSFLTYIYKLYSVNKSK